MVLTADGAARSRNHEESRLQERKWRELKRRGPAAAESAVGYAGCRAWVWSDMAD